jgi:ATP-binding cassette, subfamily F, member 3
MLQVIDLEKSYSSTPLFTNVNFTINSGERIGLLGRNGQGKSTLAKILANKESADSGVISCHSMYQRGYLEQHFSFKEATVLEEAISALPLLDGGWREEYKAETILTGLGFSSEQLQAKPVDVSGGFQVRLNLAKLLLQSPNLLILDEPTNHLDIVSIRWLREFLRSWESELLLISHDREFMDSVTTHTMGIHRQKLQKCRGNTEQYYSMIVEQEETYERTRVNQERRSAELQEFIDRFKAKASKAAAAQSKMKLLEKIKPDEKLSKITSLSFGFPEREFRGKWLLHANDLDFGYTEDNPLITELSFSLKPGQRTAIIGKNGAGKSTLLKLIAGSLTPSDGRVDLSDNASLGYFGQGNIERLNPKLTVEEEIAASNSDLSRTAVRSICGCMLFPGDSAEKKVSVLSGGERARVLLGKIIATTTNLLLLDEPTHHLDMESCAALQDALEDYSGAIVFVSHEEGFIRSLADSLIIFNGGAPKLFPGTYDEFLEREGWEDELDDAKLAKKRAKQNEKPKQKSERPKSNNALIALKKELALVEEEIIELESISESLAKELETPSHAPEKLRSISEDYQAKQTTINSLFSRMENLSSEIEAMETDS